MVKSYDAERPVLSPLLSTTLTAAEHLDIRTVELTKGPGDSLGISIAGGLGSPLGDIPIFIAMMNPAGVAAQTQLKVRDSRLFIWNVLLSPLAQCKNKDFAFF